MSEPLKHTLMVTCRTHKSPGRLGLQKSYTTRCSCGWKSPEYSRRSSTRLAGSTHQRDMEAS